MRTVELARPEAGASNDETMTAQNEPAPARTGTMRVTWRELCRLPDFRETWVALDHCRYDSVTREPIEGDLVDWDPDAAELFHRLRTNNRGACAIRYCGGPEPSGPLAS